MAKIMPGIAGEGNEAAVTGVHGAYPQSGNEERMNAESPRWGGKVRREGTETELKVWFGLLSVFTS
ncbi:MAG: hypothetical protein ACREIT_05650, partial [Tepidisphaeraceae bacterium]